MKYVISMLAYKSAFTRLPQAFHADIFLTFYVGLRGGLSAKVSFLRENI